MVLYDRRDEFEHSDSDLHDVAAFAHELRNDETFQEALQHAALELVTERAGDDIDAPARRTLAKWVADDGMGGPFQLRNQIVTNAQADLAEGDLIHMQSARDPETTIMYVVDQADPDATGVRVWRVPREDDDGPRRTDHAAGHILFCDRFAVDRAFREADDEPYTVARKLGEELEVVVNGGEA